MGLKALGRFNFVSVFFVLHESRILHSIPLTDRPFVFVLFVLNIKSKNLSLDSIRFVLASFALTKEKTVLAHFSDEFYILFFSLTVLKGASLINVLTS